MWSFPLVHTTVNWKVSRWRILQRCWLLYVVLLQQPLRAPWTSTCAPAEGACRPAWGAMGTTTVWMAQMRSAQLHEKFFKKATERCRVLFCFSSDRGWQTPQGRTSAMIRCVSLLTDRLCKGVQGRRVSLPEPGPLHPSALALRWRVGLHGPQRRGELQPGSVWVGPVHVFFIIKEGKSSNLNTAYRQGKCIYIARINRGKGKILRWDKSIFISGLCGSFMLNDKSFRFCHAAFFRPIVSQPWIHWVLKG